MARLVQFFQSIVADIEAAELAYYAHFNRRK
jgi:hypothetical protein